MAIPFQITFRNIPPSQAIENNVREKIAKLESFCQRILSCRVILESAQRHHHKGKAYRVRIDLSVPGGEIVINRSPKPLSAVNLHEARGSENDLVENHQPTKQAAQCLALITELSGKRDLWKIGSLGDAPMPKFGY